VLWVSDNRALGGGMSPGHWASYGALLAKVHATAVTDGLAKLLPRENHTHERVASIVRALESWLHMSVDEPAGVGGPADHLVRALTGEWCAAAGLVSTLLEQADGLGRELRTRRTPSVVCHGDPHLGNVLIGADERVWLIDWDDAVLAPRERDLMFVIGGVLAFAPVSPEEQSWFFDGYGVADLDPARPSSRGPSRLAPDTRCWVHDEVLKSAPYQHGCKEGCRAENRREFRPGLPSLPLEREPLLAGGWV
jgi:spectinomycin phosphotransferase